MSSPCDPNHTYFTAIFNCFQDVLDDFEQWLKQGSTFQQQPSHRNQRPACSNTAAFPSIPSAAYASSVADSFLLSPGFQLKPALSTANMQAASLSLATGTSTFWLDSICFPGISAGGEMDAKQGMQVDRSRRWAGQYTGITVEAGMLERYKINYEMRSRKIKDFVPRMEKECESQCAIIVEGPGFQDKTSRRDTESIVKKSQRIAVRR